MAAKIPFDIVSGYDKDRHDLPALQKGHSRRHGCETPRGQGRKGGQTDDHASTAEQDAGGEESEKEGAVSKPKKWDLMKPEDQEAWMEKRRNIARKYCEKNAEKIKSLKRKHYLKNKEKNKERGKEWVKNNYIKNKLLKLEHWRKNKEYYKRKLKEHSETISDVYVADLLRLKTEVLKKHPDLIDAKREQIKILRELKPTKRKKKEHAQEPEQPARSPR